MEFIYIVFTRTPGGVTVGDSGFCCCVPCLSSAIISCGLLIAVSMQNPFTYKVEEMISISTGIVPGDRIEKDKLTAYEIGKMSCDQFISQRLVAVKTDLFSPIKFSRLNRFKQKFMKSGSGGLNASTKEDKQLLIRILLLAKHRRIDLYLKSMWKNHQQDAL